MSLVIQIDSEWSADRHEQAIQAAYERGAAVARPWQPGDPRRMVRIHMHIRDSADGDILDILPKD